MKSFAKEFLRDALAKPDPQIFLGAFGKHPGWDDHMDDLGLETESLVEAKQRLYVEGIGGQIGAWEKLDAFAQVQFDHHFLWRRGSQLIVGRLWASSDGKKRARYPMVVCAHCSGAPLSLVLKPLLDCFEELRVRLAETRLAEDVRSISQQFREAVREWMAQLDVTETGPEFDGAAFLQELDFAAEGEALVKSLLMVRESAFGAGRYKERSGLPPARFRLLASSASAVRSLYFWERVLDSQLDVSAPLLLLVPADQYWMDAIVGTPTPSEFFCLRASPRALGLSSAEAAEPPEAFRKAALSVFEHLAAGKPLFAADGAARPWIARMFNP